MPTAFTTVRNQSQSLATVTDAQVAATVGTPSTTTPFTTLLYEDNNSVKTNLIEVAPGGTLYDLLVVLYVTGLPEGAYVTVRTVYWDIGANTRTTILASTIRGNSTGRVHGQHHAHARLDNFRTSTNQRLVVEAAASVSGVTATVFRVDGFMW